MVGIDVILISSVMDMDEYYVFDVIEDEEDDDDWVIEEYIRIFVKVMV